MIIIDSYDMNIYPRKLWVATGWGDAITRRFVSDDENRSELADVGDGYGAATYAVQERKTGLYGSLVVFKDVGDIGGSQIVANIAHESLHAMSNVFRDVCVEADYDNDEPMAYLVGWCAKCCWKTIQKVVYNNGKGNE